MSEYTLFACGCTQSGSGVYRYTLKDGVLTEKDKISLDGAMFIAKHENKLFVPVRNYSDINADGSLYSIDFDEKGFKAPKLISSSYGAVPCHNIYNDGYIYLVNYVSGNIAKISEDGKEHTVVQHKGDSINKPRQDKEHTHQIMNTPDGKYFTVCDLGMDRIFLYDKNLELCSSEEAPLGQGPRHIAFSSDGRIAYCVNELSCTVTMYAYLDGALVKMMSVDTLYGKNRLAGCTAAAIKLSPGGDRLYVSVRKCNSIICFDLTAEGIPVYNSSFDSHGNSPRDIEISPDGKNLVCANEEGKIVLFDIGENGRLSYTGTQFELPGALCVIFG